MSPGFGRGFSLGIGSAGVIADARASSWALCSCRLQRLPIARGLCDSPVNFGEQQVSATCPLPVVPCDGRFELLQRLWMELEKHHFRVRDFLMRASTSSQGIVFASPLSI